jgi:predicted component of type VI protein secretion system
VSAYNIRENSTIGLIGGHPLPSAPTAAPPSRVSQPKVKEPPSEQGTISAIRSELERVRTTLVPDVDELIGALAPSVATTTSSLTPAPTPAPGIAAAQSFSTPAQVPPIPPYPTPASYSSKPTPADHTRLSELLLQSLLRLDAMHLAGSDWPDARAERKAAVREVQGVLDRLDGAWSAR